VWDLEAGTGAEVARPTLGSEFDDETEAQNKWEGIEKGSVIFDERRIISSGIGGVQVRRFDV
jgi:hypothetical protein